MKEYRGRFYTVKLTYKSGMVYTIKLAYLTGEDFIQLSYPILQGIILYCKAILFYRGGFYTVKLGDKFRLISLNMNYCNNGNW